MSFQTPYETSFFHINRVTNGGKLVRRILCLSADGSIVVCKPSGVVCRTVHNLSLSSVFVAPLRDVQQLAVLLRFEEEEPDLTFYHVLEATPAPPAGTTVIDLERVPNGGNCETPPPEGSDPGDGSSYPDGLSANSQHAYPQLEVGQHHRLEHVPLTYIARVELSNIASRFAQQIVRFRDDHAAPPLVISARPSWRHILSIAESRLLDLRAGDVLMYASKPCRGHDAVLSTVLTPTFFDPIPIVDPAAPDALGTLSASHVTLSTSPFAAEETAISADISFLNMLYYSVEVHPVAATKVPLLLLDAPPPFRSIHVSQVFFEAFVASFKAQLPLHIRVHSHLPAVSIFRASTRFWHYVKRCSSTRRLAIEELGMIAKGFIHVYPEHAPAEALALPMNEWNTIVLDWDVGARRNADALAKTVVASSLGAFAGASGGGNEGAVSVRDLTADTALFGDVYWASFVEEIDMIAREKSNELHNTTLIRDIFSPIRQGSAVSVLH